MERLLYASRMALNAPVSLHALLACCLNGKPMPWADLLLKDLKALSSAMPHKLSELPEPSEHIQP
eukprot:10865185-Karenia_brevis.AAC.1